MKISNYTIVIEDDSNVFLFNTRSSSFIRLLPEFRNISTWLRIPHGSSGPSADFDAWFNALEPSAQTALLEGEFVIPDDIDELTLLKVMNRCGRFAMDSLVMTIVTTHACNFNCIYCYEHKHLAAMSVEVQDKIIEYVRKQQQTLKNLSITWFGGEPLVAYDVILRLSAGIIDICLKNGINYSADIITNGYLLNRKKVQELSGLGVASAQITIDGPAEIHDSRRMLRSGKGTFARIIRNIKDVHDLISIVIRVNIDRDNSAAAYELIEQLHAEGLAGAVQLDFAPVHRDGRGCRERMAVENAGGTSPDNSIFTLREYCRENVRLHTTASGMHLSKNLLPPLRSNACAADLAHSFVIEPNGDLHKCWQTISDEQEKIGDVFSGMTMNMNHCKWLTFDPFEIDKCRQCQFLPMCMGWCPYRLMRDTSEESCNAIKHTLRDALLLFYREQREDESTLPVSL